MARRSGCVNDCRQRSWLFVECAVWIFLPSMFLPFTVSEGWVHRIHKRALIRCTDGPGVQRMKRNGCAEASAFTRVTTVCASHCTEELCYQCPSESPALVDGANSFHAPCNESHSFESGGKSRGRLCLGDRSVRFKGLRNSENPPCITDRPVGQASSLADQAGSLFYCTVGPTRFSLYWEPS